MLGDGRTLPAHRESDVDGGTRLTVDVPHGVSTIALAHSEGKFLWSLTIRDARSIGEVERLVALGRAGSYAEALRGLDSLRERALPADQGPIDAAVGRMALALGNVDRAEPALRAAMHQARSDGRVSDVVRDGAALVWLLVMLQQRFVDARSVLGDMEASARQYPEGSAWIAYHSGLLAAQTGDVRTALHNYREAERRARRLRQTSLAENASMEVAVQLVAVGRADEALRLLRALPPPSDTCAQASLALNIEWTLSRKSSRLPARLADPEIVEAAGLAEKATDSCPDPHRRMLAAIHAAERAIQLEDDSKADQALRIIRAMPPLRDVRLASWRSDVLGRWFLRRNSPARALYAFEEQTKLARGAGLQEEAFRGEVGAGRALLALRRRTAGITRLEAALKLLETMVREIPIGDGRGTFLDGHDDGVRALVSALVDGGLLDDALQVSRWMRTVELVHTARGDRLQRLAPNAQRKWDEALERYQRVRREIETQAERDWEIPGSAVARARSGRQARAEDARAALDEAYRLLVADEPQGKSRLSSPIAGEVLLAFFPARDGWYAFAATSSTTEVRRFPDEALTSLVAAGKVLDSFSNLLGTARTVRLLPYGAANRVDWQFAPFKGHTLLSGTEVVYGLDLPSRSANGPISASPLRAVVVADPTGDLPGALAEATMISRELSAWNVSRLDGRNITRANLLDSLPHASLFHYAGHAEVSSSQVLANALILAGNARIELGDLLAAGSMPDLVVLSACEAAGTSGDRSSLLGLAQTFVAAGSLAAVAPARPVSDMAARAFFGAFYRVFGRGGADLERTFREAFRSAALQLAAQNSDGPDSGDWRGWASFRLLVP